MSNPRLVCSNEPNTDKEDRVCMSQSSQIALNSFRQFFFSCSLICITSIRGDVLIWSPLLRVWTLLYPNTADRAAGQCECTGHFPVLLCSGSLWSINKGQNFKCLFHWGQPTVSSAVFWRHSHPLWVQLQDNNATETNCSNAVRSKMSLIWSRTAAFHVCTKEA